MRILLVSRYKEIYWNNILPFVYEQGEALRALGCEVDYFLIKGDGSRAYWSAVAPLKEKIKEYKPDLVHAHFGLSVVTAVMQSLVPVVATFHNGEILTKGVNLLSSFAAKRAKHSVFVAQHIYDGFYLKPKSYSIIPCGIDLSKMPLQEHAAARKKVGFKDGEKYVLFGGAFSNLRKNYPLLEKAVKLIEGDYRINVLEMKGFTREQLNDLMYACDVFALPSKSEGSPQALKEAMACGCPIVATPVGDIEHLIDGVEGCYLSGFDENELAAALRSALDFNSRTAGRQRIEELGLDNKQVAERLISIYKNVLSTK